MKKRLNKDTKIVISAIAILVVMIFLFNTGITGNPILRWIRSVPTISVPASEDKGIDFPEIAPIESKLVEPVVSNIALKTKGTICTSAGDVYRAGQNYGCNNAIDGKSNTYWSISAGGKKDNYPKNTWIKLDLAKETWIDKIVLKSINIKAIGWIKKGTLTLYDSSGNKVETINDITVPYGRSEPNGITIPISPKKIKSVRFDIIQTWGPNAGLSEFEIYVTSETQDMCTDSDGGKKYNIKGTISIKYTTGYVRTETDTCNSDGTLREWYCGKLGDPAGLLRSENYVKCPSNTRCSNGACVQSSNDVGLIIVKKGSNLESKSREIAQTKGWYFKTLDTSNPKEIRQNIKEIYLKSKFKYLLIIGDDGEIPILDYNHVLPSESSDPSDLDLVLDSYYYGTIGDLTSSFVTLSVGRLPFNNPNEIDDYYNSFNQGGLPFSEFYPFAFPPVSVDQFTDVDFSWYKECVKERFSTLNINKNSEKNDFLERLQKASIFSVNTHGGPIIMALKSGAGFETGDIPLLHLNTNPIFIALSCNVAQNMGKELLKNGVGAFIGNYNLAGYESHTILEYLLKGNSVGDAVKDQINKRFLAQYSMVGNVKNSWGEQGIQNIDILIPTKYYGSQRDTFGLILYGDPSFSKPKVQTAKDSMKFSQEENKIIIDINPPKSIKITDDFKLLCYNSINQITTNFDNDVHEMSIVFEVKGVNKIDNIQIYKNEIKLDDSVTQDILKSSTFMLVKDSVGTEFIVIFFNQIDKNDKLKFILNYQ